MDTMYYVRTTLSVPGAGTAIHVAELKELDNRTCEMQRLVALDPQSSVVGAACGNVREGNIDIPSSKVPHPSTYGDFPDIEASYLEQDEFEQLWSKARAVFPRL